MKNVFVAILSLIVSRSAIAAPTLAKTCVTGIADMNSGALILTTIEIFEDSKTFTAKITRGNARQASTFEDAVEVFDQQFVRASLTKASDADDFNLAERSIVHAMGLTESLAFEHRFSVGLDLHAIRLARVYQVGRPTDMESLTIIEAQGLGSFVDGMVVSPCK